MKKLEAILYFDGECILCNRCIGYLLKKDQKKLFKIGYLNDAHNLQLEPNIDSIVLSLDGQLFTYSDAVLRSLVLIGGAYRAVRILFIIPKSVRDFFYKIIARNRYQWFGKYDNCPTPSKDWKDRLI
jgi:predicted DCC family thiol-disulfide oxidoreductase YuxK